MQVAPVERYSSDVTLRLLIDDRTLRLAQVGPNVIILRDRFETATTDATLVITVDGQERKQPIVLPNGLTLTQEEFRYF